MTMQLTFDFGGGLGDEAFRAKGSTGGEAGGKLRGAISLVISVR